MNHILERSLIDIISNLKMQLSNTNMENPLSFVKNTRKKYDRFHQTIVTEVQVQFDDEMPAWIPYSTLMGIQKWSDKLH